MDLNRTYYFADWQGNNAAVVSADGNLVQKTDYYPYGEPTVEPSGQRYLFSGKEREHAAGRNSYDFGARSLTPYGQWSSPDKKAETFYSLSPYSYCGGDPINRVDQDGKIWDTIWDVGNVLYDVGSAIKAHIDGDHDTAKEYWKDAAFDTGAALIPFVPAGATKVVKIVKKVDKTSDASKVLRNADRIKEGSKLGQTEFEKALDRGEDVVKEKTLAPLNREGNVKGNRTKVDQLIRDGDGNFNIIETKLTNKTRLSPGQQKAYDNVKTGNKMFEIRSNIKEFNLTKGQIIEVKDYQIITKEYIK